MKHFFTGAGTQAPPTKNVFAGTTPPASLRAFSLVGARLFAFFGVRFFDGAGFCLDAGLALSKKVFEFMAKVYFFVSSTSLRRLTKTS